MLVVCASVNLFSLFLFLSQLSEVEERLAQLEALVGSKESAVVGVIYSFPPSLPLLTLLLLLPQSTVAAGLDAEQKDLSVCHVTITL